MKTYIPYRNIPKVERRMLAAEAIRHSKPLGLIQFASILIPTPLGGTFAREFAPAAPAFERLAIVVGVALLISAIIWESMGRPKLKAEIERLKNA